MKLIDKKEENENKINNFLVKSFRCNNRHQ